MAHRPDLATKPYLPAHCVTYGSCTGPTCFFWCTPDQPSTLHTIHRPICFTHCMVLVGPGLVHVLHLAYSAWSSAENTGLFWDVCGTCTGPTQCTMCGAVYGASPAYRAVPCHLSDLWTIPVPFIQPARSDKFNTPDLQKFLTISLTIAVAPVQFSHCHQWKKRKCRLTPTVLLYCAV